MGVLNKCTLPAGPFQQGSWRTRTHPMTNPAKSMVNRPRPFTLAAALAVVFIAAPGLAAREEPRVPAMPRVRVSEHSKQFVLAGTGKPFVPWGFNYLGRFEHLAEDDWDTPAGWKRVE